MTRTIPALALAALAAVSLAGPALAQGVPPLTPPRATTAQAPAAPNVAAQSYKLKSVDARTLNGGLRSTKVVGTSVVNEANETIGTVDDLIVVSNDKAPYAVISVGGFLGMGSRYVVVPYGSLQRRDNKVILRGATKDSLRALNEYKYPT